MKVYVNGKYGVTRLTGVQRVAIEMVRALREVIAAERRDIELVVLEPPGWLRTSRLRPVVALLWEQFVLPLRARGGLLLSLTNTGPLLKRRHVIVLHDAAVFDMPQNYGRRYVLIHRWLMRRHARQAMRIFTVSQFSKERLAHHLGIAPEAIGTIGLGAEHVLRLAADASILTRLGVPPGGYLLSIGSRQPGKNFGALAQAVRAGATQLPVVVAGGVNTAVFGSSATVTSPLVIEAGYVSDAELKALLERAVGYVQPSLYEGFGLPALEAMALGVPVLCARAAALPEVCGEAAQYFDPRDPADLAKSLRVFAADEVLRQRLGYAGLARATAFSWRRSALQLLTDLGL